MSPKVIIGIIATCLCLSSCSRHDERIIYVDSSGVEAESVHPSSTLENIVQSSSNVLFFKDHLLIINSSTIPEEQFLVYSLNDGSMHGYFKRGRGPGEMLGLYDCSLMDGGESLAFLDVVSKKIWVAPSDAILSGSFTYDHAEIMDSPDGIILLNIAGGEDTIYSTGTLRGKRIVTVGMDGSVSYKGEYSPDVNEKEPNEFVNQAYMGNTAYNERHHSVVIANRYADQIEILNLETGKVRFIKGPEAFEPKYTIVKTAAGSALAHERDERLGYVCSRVKDNNIYVLFSGKTNSQRNASFGNEVRVFDWNGRLRRIIDLGMDVLSFDVSDNGKKLYASADDMILVFDI